MKKTDPADQEMLERNGKEKTVRSVFKKFLLKELGKSNYQNYVECYKKLIREKKYDAKKLENREIFEAIYQLLHKNNGEELKNRLERLLDTMVVSVQISRHYVFNLIFGSLAILFLLSLGLVPVVGTVSSALVGAMMVYKTFQFFINRFSVIDAHIMLIYKSVLDVLLISEKARNMI